VTRGDHALAQDATQAAFTAAVVRWPYLRRLNEAEREGWLKRIAAEIAGTMGITEKAVSSHVSRVRGPSTEPSTGASSSTTCPPATSGGLTGSRESC
jgi:alkylation response protein AidB-like acyl-CoA dehydrogenase